MPSPNLKIRNFSEKWSTNVLNSFEIPVWNEEISESHRMNRIQGKSPGSALAVYFGHAKDLLGVKELFMSKKKEKDEGSQMFAHSEKFIGQGAYFEESLIGLPIALKMPPGASNNTNQHPCLTHQISRRQSGKLHHKQKLATETAPTNSLSPGDTARGASAFIPFLSHRLGNGRQVYSEFIHVTNTTVNKSSQ
ncbi:hypothetical protein K439DRAFT_279747 [Ramaria rubella]|nr:hypothetical protein K439DRAFT_279747 [Ramaria rubella]